MESIGPPNVGILRLQLDHMRASHELVEAALRRHHRSIDKWYEAQRMIVDDDEIAEDRAYLEELLAEQRKEADEAYPWLLRASLFAVGYGILEHFLVTVCKQAEHYLPGRPRLSDLRGEGIVRARVYLAKVVRLDFPNTQEWQDLTIYGRLRNLALHAQGEVADHVNVEPIQFVEAIATFGDQFEDAWRAPRPEG